MSTVSRDREFHFLVYILCLCSGILFVIYKVNIKPESSESTQYNQFNQYLKAFSRSRKRLDGADRTRTILLWNHYFNFDRWGLPNDSLGPEYFREQRCPVVNCLLTNKKDIFPSVEMYDAIVFHTAERYAFDPPVRRSSSQYYVFALKEPPGETRHLLGDEGGFYNLTMTYRLDSDILWSYMNIEDIESGEIVAPALNPSWRRPPEEYSNEEVDTLVAGKTKFSAWFVSHCDTLSRRERLAKMLGKYVDVDIYGACGPFKCTHFADECDLMLDKDYKFYLAFENSLCMDYVTEKFYNALKRQIVPIVFGGANYTRFAPPHSYINADNFATVKELGLYLIHLHTHPKEYAKYFWWRQYYRVTFKPPFCDLCAKLNEPAPTKKAQYYTDIENWWLLKDSCSFESKIPF